MAEGRESTGEGGTALVDLELLAQLMLKHMWEMFLPVTSQKCLLSTGQDADKHGADECLHGGA